MSSILTNNGAMVALQTLKSINTNLGKTQEVISTGKMVGSAKDNSAVWAISKVMESDVQGFKAISSSLSLGESTVSVARQASETVTDLLIQMKDKIVASQEDNVDRAKIQLDIDALSGQVTSVVGAAQFNGLNLLSNTETEAGSGTVNVLSSLDRSASGVAASDISVRKQDLGTDVGGITGTWTATVDDAATLDSTTSSASVAITAPTAAGSVYGLSVFGTDADDSAFVQADYQTGAAAVPADAAELSQIMYVSRDGDTAADVAKGLETAYKTYAAENGLDSDVLTMTATATGLDISTSAITEVGDDLVVGVYAGAAGADGVATIGGGLEALAGIDVTTTAGADSALTSIEFMIDTAIDSAAAFGSAQGRIETQSQFVSKITDALKSGIGTLVDANMEETSARLQALQVQQQLGVQSLSIANQAPQSILSLFR